MSDASRDRLQVVCRPGDFGFRQIASAGDWPLVLFLHGAGERGDNLELVKTHGPPKLVANGKSFPFVLASPQCPRGNRWKSFELIALIDKLCREHKIDPDRIYVTGLSMGGFGTWELAADYPDRLAAIAPICGGGEPFWAGPIRNIPCWAFHGDKDQVVPPGRTEAMVKAIQAAGGNPKLTLYPEAGHDSWTETCDNPEFFAWLLEQSRKTGENGKQ